MELEVYSTFNMSLLVNDRPLRGITSIVVKDFKELFCTKITLNRRVSDGIRGDAEDIIELMRNQQFSFKLMNNTVLSGWVTLNAELESYEMSFSLEDAIL